jgi:hypothetical protein
VNVLTGANCGSKYKNGTSVSLQANPAAGDNEFSSWSGACSGQGASCSLSMNSDKSTTANFTNIPCYSLSTGVSPSGSGSVSTSLISGNTCSGGYRSGAQVQLTANPNSGYVFSNWSTGSGSNPITITINNNTSVTANFSQQCYTLSYSTSGSGSVGVSPGPNCGGAYTHGTSVTLTASPSGGWLFSYWSGACSGQGSSCSLSMTANRNTTAVFVENVPPPPPTPTNVNLVVVRMNGDYIFADATWNASSGATSYWYNFIGTPGENDEGTTSGTGASTINQITCNSGNINFYVKARNSGGESSAGFDSASTSGVCGSGQIIIIIPVSTEFKVDEIRLPN